MLSAVLCLLFDQRLGGHQKQDPLLTLQLKVVVNDLDSNQSLSCSSVHAHYSVSLDTSLHAFRLIGSQRQTIRATSDHGRLEWNANNEGHQCTW